MFWKGFRPLTVLSLTATIAGCSHYPFKYEPYHSKEAFASWSEMEAAVSRIESYASTCRPEPLTVSCQQRLEDEYEHVLARIEITGFRLAPAHINRLNALRDRLPEQ
ncbi:hypothetical protein M3P05_14450 [Sansalvadorimonas sp. 2012CJ34-2]|uniref:Lipoprotein n=1 Tax=Parendozoicomonas callyspongiae TaxID=2942213 RepID=A0ABT0PL09_9GAMM|nr:hypothetical protein [Sansalvadorimonas sp. 2012CJ34-2]MCL6271123.1 hypothetical protein [Sansalvadorimonas sp. 2012CJ34-2]